jgi:arylsulfatase
LGSGSQAEHEFLYWEFPSNGGQQAVRMGNWKGVRTNIIQEGNLQIELYDLDEDPAEENDIASDHPDIVDRIRDIFQSEHTVPEIERFRMKALGDPSP